MKLEAGKYYKTVTGSKAYIMGQLPDGTFVGNINNVVFGWNNDGEDNSHYYTGARLIEEWVEPKKVKVDCWINIYSDGDYSMHTSRSMADEFKIPTRIACIHIEREVEEGEGL